MKGFYTSPVDDKTLTLKSGNYSLKTSITCLYKKRCFLSSRTFYAVNDCKYFLFELHIY